MEQRISVVTLGIADLERSRRFYEEGLGWKRGNSDKEIVFFQIGGSIFALFPRADLAKDARLSGEGGGFGGFALGYNTRTKEEVDRIIEKARAAGATVLLVPEDAFWGGYHAYFADPDGHTWEIAWNPGWLLAEDGSVSLTKSGASN